MEPIRLFWFALPSLARSFSFAREDEWMDRMGGWVRNNEHHFTARHIPFSCLADLLCWPSQPLPRILATMINAITTNRPAVPIRSQSHERLLVQRVSPRSPSVDCDWLAVHHLNSSGKSHHLPCRNRQMTSLLSYTHSLPCFARSDLARCHEPCSQQAGRRWGPFLCCQMTGWI